jgi:hypothetical protein
LFSSKSGITQEALYAIVILVRNADINRHKVITVVTDEQTCCLLTCPVEVPFGGQYFLFLLDRKYSKKITKSFFLFLAYHIYTSPPNLLINGYWELLPRE